MNVAIFAPNENAYSETFIQAHKNKLPHRIYYYYGSRLTMKLQGEEELICERSIGKKLWGKLSLQPFRKAKWQGLLKSVKKNEIDVMLVEYGTHAFDLIDFLEVVNIPFVVHFHGYDASVTSVVRSCNNYKRVFKNASYVISVSEVMSAILLELGCPKDKLIKNIYGPNPDFATIAPNFNNNQFIAVGRFTDKKAPYYLILSFVEVVKKFPNARLLIAGNGSLYNACLNLIRFYGLENNIDLIGVIAPQKYQSLLEESIGFVQHSITSLSGDMEGTPLAILEASSAGLPVISTYHAGISEVIVNNETGILVNEHDVVGFSMAMIELLSDKEKALRFGAKGKEYIKNNFSMDRHIDTLSNVLKEANKNAD